MTQPNPGDYITPGRSHPTPRTTTPGHSTADDNGVEPRGASIVQMQESAWRLRAQAATDAAEELMKIRAAVAKVLARNYFGDGCLEGEAVYDALKLAFGAESGWGGALQVQAKALAGLAESCTHAAASLRSADTISGDRIATIAT